MFGIPIITCWAVMYVKNKTTYYLSETNDDCTKIVWTRRKEKSRKYALSSDAIKCAEQIKLNHNNKKLDVSVAQV